MNSVEIKDPDEPSIRKIGYQRISKYKMDTEHMFNSKDTAQVRKVKQALKF